MFLKSSTMSLDREKSSYFVQILCASGRVKNVQINGKMRRKIRRQLADYHVYYQNVFFLRVLRLNYFTLLHNQ